jgi:mitogen-activated protein kinase kinase
MKTPTSGEIPIAGDIKQSPSPPIKDGGTGNRTPMAHPSLPTRASSANSVPGVSRSAAGVGYTTTTLPIRPAPPPSGPLPPPPGATRKQSDGPEKTRR